MAFLFPVEQSGLAEYFYVLGNRSFRNVQMTCQCADAESVQQQEPDDRIAVFVSKGFKHCGSVHRISPDAQDSEIDQLSQCLINFVFDSSSQSF